ncbi:hypothetical protein ACTA71_010806 [Dictyostelium dimigraforme]
MKVINLILLVLISCLVVKSQDQSPITLVVNPNVNNTYVIGIESFACNSISDAVAYFNSIAVLVDGTIYQQLNLKLSNGTYGITESKVNLFQFNCTISPLDKLVVSIGSIFYVSGGSLSVLRVRVQVPTPAFSCPSLIPSNPSVTTQIPSILQCYNPKIPSSAPPSVAIQFPSFPSNLRLIGQVCSRKIKWQKEKCRSNYALCNKLNFWQVKKVTTSAYHPQTDGLVEHFHSALLQMLKAYIDETNHSDWLTMLKTVLFSYRITPHPTTGFSPFYLLYGRIPQLPINIPLKLSSDRSYVMVDVDVRDQADILKNHYLRSRFFVHQNIAKAQINQKNAYDKHRTPSDIQVGDTVFVHFPVDEKSILSHKLKKPWTGPFKVLEKINDNAFKIDLKSNHHPVINVDRLKKFTPLDMNSF